MKNALISNDFMFGMNNTTAILKLERMCRFTRAIFSIIAVFNEVTCRKYC